MSILRPLPLSRRSFLAGSAAAGVGSFLIPGRAHAQEAEFTVKVATVAPAGTPWATHLKAYKKKVQEGSGGRIKVKTYLGGGLGDEIATAEATKRGSIQVFGGTAGALATAVPELDVLELPYLFPSEKAADKVLDEVIHDDLEKLLLDRGFKLMFFSENGYRSIGSTFGPVRSPADLAGKRMRSQESKVHLNTWSAMGANPKPMAVTEVLSSLQSGALDGFDNTALFTFAGSWYQAITHFSLTEHIYQMGIVVASKAFWDTLPPDLQAVVAGDWKAESAYGRKGVRAIGGLLLKNFENAGIQIVKLSDAERAAFKKASLRAHEQFADKASKDGKKLYDKIKKAV
jgi:tripartite ATP-independent transporter DctP family solute receptor